MRFPFSRREERPLLGWFGKLPAVGDFAGRGLPLALRESVDGWCEEGMKALVDGGSVDWREAYLVSPVWHFVMNAGVWHDNALTGCFAPSIDRIGRCSPLIVLRSFDAARISEVLPPTSDWLHEADRLIRRVVGDVLPVEAVLPRLEAASAAEKQAREGRDEGAGGILADLGIGAESWPPPTWFSWPGLKTRFDERRMSSYWWAEPSPKKPPLQFIHGGKPDAALFALLMGGWVGREHP